MGWACKWEGQLEILLARRIANRNAGFYGGAKQMEILSIFKHALMITVFVFVMMLLVDFIDTQSERRMTEIMQGDLWQQYTLASFLGSTPGCLGAFINVSLYVHGIISFGAIVGGLAFWNLDAFVREHMMWVLLIGALIGMVPESGPHLIFVMMYAQGLVPFSVLFTASFVQDGHGMLPLLSYSIKDSILIKVFNLAFGIAVGGALFALGL